MAKIATWADLVRVPNTLTVVADILAGMSLVGMAGISLWSLLATSSASVCIYWFGMIRNDYADIDYDRSVGRQRPLVDGSISKRSAVIACLILLCAATLLLSSSVVSIIKSVDISPQDWSGTFFPGARVAVIFIALLLCVWTYNSRLKLTLFGPLLMGCCRGFNLLLGAMVCASANLVPDSSAIHADWIPFGWHVLVAATAMSIYVAGFTLAAQREEEVGSTGSDQHEIPNNSKDLSTKISSERFRIVGWAICALGVLLFGLVPSFRSEELNFAIRPEFGYWLLIGIVALPVIRRATRCVISNSPKLTGAAVRQAIYGIIGFDAALTAGFSGIAAGLAVAALLIPTMLMGVYFRPS